jgi:hypothetical protein
MAQKTIVTLTDDIDGKAADETVRFGLDGVNYEIDLRAANAAKLRKVLEPYKSAARRATTARKDARGGRSSTTHDRKRAAEIRAWAKDHEIPVNERGRIASDLAAAFEANDPSLATGKSVPQATFSS